MGRRPYSVWDLADLWAAVLEAEALFGNSRWRRRGPTAILRVGLGGFMGRCARGWGSFRQ